ncbi:hypothetical protein TNCV_1341021 [Trichonephila clavipes]|uniref:Uncharacterized protein n=1 Tax=Trichonephila clavipes TaxID=2585209 RepID=A0A8X6V5F8_TRICX|nr:hypothetical protein TNCV_1341021 [Trichonephila clavipes]
MGFSYEKRKRQSFFKINIDNMKREVQWLSGSGLRFHTTGPRTDYLIGTSSHDPEERRSRILIWGTVGLGPHGLLRPTELS